MSQTPLFLRLLANRSLKPAGFLLDFVGCGDETVRELLSRTDFVALASAFPCLIDPLDETRLSPASIEGLQNLGIGIVAGYQLHRAEKPVTEPLPPAVQWLVGDWYCAPPPKPKANQIASRTLALKLLQLVESDAETVELENVFRADPTLSYHLLRLVNSVAFSPARRINSFSQAIVMLGRSQLRRWLTLMLFAASKDNPNAPMLLARATVRARTMELLAQSAGFDRQKQDQAFMAGLLSLVGILFGMPLASLLQPLSINESLSSALLRQEGELGLLLRIAEYSEFADAAALLSCFSDLRLQTNSFTSTLIEAHQWMLDLLRSTGGITDA